MSTIKYFGFFILIISFSQSSFSQSLIPNFHEPMEANEFLFDSLTDSSKCIGSCGTGRSDCVKKVFRKPPKKSKINLGLNACGVNLANCFEKCDQALDSALTIYQNATNRP